MASNISEIRYLLGIIGRLKAEGLMSFTGAELVKNLTLQSDPKLFELAKRFILQPLADLKKSVFLHDLNKRLDAYEKEILEKLFADYSSDDAHIVACECIDTINDCDTSALVYGEVGFDSFKEVLMEAIGGLKFMKKFVDLGHGTGKAIFMVIVNIMYTFKICII